MNKFALCALASLFAIPSVVSAQTYKLTQAGDSWAVSPAKFTVTIKPWDQQPKPDCDKLWTTLQNQAATIDRCAPGGSQPATVCSLLKKTLPKAIFGVDDPAGPLEEDVEQFFEVGAVAYEPIPALADIAAKSGIPQNRLVLATQDPWQQGDASFDVKLKPGAGSWVEKLARLEYLQDYVGQITLGTDKSFGVSDRVTYCELVRGLSSLEGRSQYKSTVQAGLSNEAWEWTQSLYTRLAQLKYPLGGTIEQQALAIGYEIGLHVLEHPIADNERVNPQDIFKAFFEKNANTLKIKKLSPQDIKTQLSVKYDFNLVSDYQASMK
jgi:hypothetical protein